MKEMRIFKKHKKLWTALAVIATTALILTSIIPIILVLLR